MEGRNVLFNDTLNTTFIDFSLEKETESVTQKKTEQGILNHS